MQMVEIEGVGSWLLVVAAAAAAAAAAELRTAWS